MPIVHFLNVLEGDCNIIEHDSDRVTVIDVSNAYNDLDTVLEAATKKTKENIFKKRRLVPSGKIDYKQKEHPENPIEYLKRLGINSIFRFIITHPDMDHIDGIEDFYSSLNIANTWDTDNVKHLDIDGDFGGYNPDDWKFYINIRDGKNTTSTRLSLYSGNENQFWTNDNIKILCPTHELVNNSNRNPKSDFHDCSYVILFTPPKADGKIWKILFAGDSHDNSWDYILENHEEEVKNVDVLFAPHHGRDSNRKYDFLKVLNPRLTLFGNASSEHLAYSSYKPMRITNNQAGSIILNIDINGISVFVKNKQFAIDFTTKRKWTYSYDKRLDAFGIIRFK